MFYIDQTTSMFVEAKKAHYKNLRYIIKKKLLGKSFNEPNPNSRSQRINRVKNIQKKIFNFLDDEDNLRNLLIGPPEILNDIKNKFKSKESINSIKAIINYSSFSVKERAGSFRFYNGFHLASALGHHTCIYCNRSYTSTVITEKGEFIVRPTFDHWFPQSKFPLLALSFYNLIPSCSICNMTIKGSTEFGLNDVFHPYLKHSDPNQQLSFRFSYDLEDHLVAKNIINADNEFSSRSLKVMQLSEIYRVHNEETRELIYLKKAYSESYLTSLESILKSTISKADVYRLAFGVYMEDKLLNKRPLGKLKKDILTELGFVN